MMGSPSCEQLQRARAGAIGLERREERRVDGSGDTRGAAHPRHRAAEPRRLEPVACVEIVQHRGLHLRGKAVGEIHLLGDEIVGERDAVRAADRPRLAYRRFERRAQIGIAAQHAQRLPRDARQAGERRQERELLPQRARMSAESSASMPALLHAASERLGSRLLRGVAPGRSAIAPSFPYAR